MIMTILFLCCNYHYFSFCYTIVVVIVIVRIYDHRCYGCCHCYSCGCCYWYLFFDCCSYRYCYCCLFFFRNFLVYTTGSTIRTLLHGKINPKDWQVWSLGDVGFLLFFRVVWGDYGKPCIIMIISIAGFPCQLTRSCWPSTIFDVFPGVSNEKGATLVVKGI